MPTEKPSSIPFSTIRGSQEIKVLIHANNRMAALELTGGKCCLFAPLIALANKANPTSEVAYLLAPNHYHNKGLRSFASRYPKAILCASNRAKARLDQQTGLNHKSLIGFKRRLAKSMAILEPEGLKTGEVWLRVELQSGCAWLVTDAFCGTKMTTTKASMSCKEPHLLGTFPSFGVKDKAVYLDWVTRQANEDKPKMVIPCHGAVIAGRGLAQKMIRLLETSFA